MPAPAHPGWRLASGADDVDRVLHVLAEGFSDDPLWGLWALPETTERYPLLRRHWTPFVRAALQFDGVVMSPGGEAVAVWVPPGVPELDEAQEEALSASTEEIFGTRAPLLFDLYDRFTAAHPTQPEHPPHWCLSLLATAPEYRGQGAGMRLVADFLEGVDAAHQPAYLESTNPANLARYGRAGFEPYGSFTPPTDPGVADPTVTTPTVTTMWRPAR